MVCCHHSQQPWQAPSSFIWGQLRCSYRVEKVPVDFMVLFPPLEEPQEISDRLWGYLSASWTWLSTAPGRASTSAVVLGHSLAFFLLLFAEKNASLETLWTPRSSALGYFHPLAHSFSQLHKP